MNFRFRKHQGEIDRIITEIEAGADITDILAYIIPGGGKSLLAIIVGRLIPKFIKTIVWVVPRKNLQYQGEANFVDPVFRKMLGHTLVIRATKNERDPARGTNGFTTTCQALCEANSHHIRRSLEPGTYALLIDEVHHIKDGGVWHSALNDIYQNARLRVMMTGTLARGDKEKIAFIPYKEEIVSPRKKILSPMVEDGPGYRYIRYTRKDALEEKAILPIEFHLYDGKFKWKEHGVEYTADGFMSQTALENRASALYTAISTEYGEKMINAGISHWRKYGSGATEMLFVTADFKQARNTLAYLESVGMKARIATSHESKEANKNIEDFKRGAFPALVTIAMAYEGMDAPRVSHIVALTRVRSMPWIEQMVARAVRVDSRFPYESQQAHVFAPVDPEFQQIVMKIKAEQESASVQVKKKCVILRQASLFEDDPLFGDDEAEGGGGLGIIPMGSDITGKRMVSIGGDGAGAQDGIVVVRTPGPPTPTEEERELREKINRQVCGYARIHGYRESSINREIKERFENKPRGNMTIQELVAVWKFVKAAYPLYGAPIPPGVETEHEPRASVSRRVDTKARPFTGEFTRASWIG